MSLRSTAVHERDRLSHCGVALVQRAPHNATNAHASGNV